MGDGLFAGRYELAELLGSGGMARVHRARDTRLGRVVAIKTLKPELALDPDARQRFAREAYAAGALNHPGVVTVHDQDEYQDGDVVVPYLVMEFVRGGTLAELVRERAPFEPERAVRIVCDMLDALAHAHAHGTVHRDVKPANVMITEDGAVKVADFGIARVRDTDTRLTAAGSSVGTPGYMSPEQINGSDVDARSDIYAVGCVLSELLTGKPPFHDGNPLSIMFAHVHTPPPVPSTRNPRVPEALDTLVLAALAKSPGDRPADAGIYRARLWAWLTAAGPAATSGPAWVAPGDFGLRPPDPAPRPGGYPRATYGAGGALPAQGLPADAARPPNPAAQPPAAPPGFQAQPYQAAQGLNGPQGPQPPQAPQTPQTPQTPLSPLSPQGPHTPAPAPPGLAEHPAYSRTPQVPLPPPYQPSTPPPVGSGPGAGVLIGAGAAGRYPPPGGPVPKRGWSGRQKVLTGVAGLAVAGITVSVVFATGALGGSSHPTPGPTRTTTPTTQQAALKRHGGSLGRGYNGGLNGVVRPSVKTGGTVDLAVSYMDTSLLDPADTYTPSAWNLERLLLRNLVGYAPAPGKKGRTLVPDLATDTGKVSDDGLTWTFHLKGGLHFQDGSPITSKDIKYGVERSFDRTVHGGGASYFAGLLDEGQHYPGPYKDSDPDKMGLKSVATPDDTTVVFTLAKPDTDFPNILALPIGAAVPPSADTGGGKDFETHLVASGPYKVDAYQPGKSLRLVRNPEWTAGTDPIRSQLPAAYDLQSYDSQDAVEQALLGGKADLDLNETLLGDDTETKIVGSAAQKANADLAYNDATRYLSLQTDVAPFDKAGCRQAVEYAVDRSEVKAALGGQYEGGDVATTMLPPTNNSYDPQAAQYTAHDGKPDIADALSRLSACGKKDGFTTTLAGIDGNPRGTAAMQAVAASLKLVGVNVKIETLQADTFYDTLTTPSKLKAAKWGMVYTSWVGDYPTGGGFLQQLVQPDGYGNYAGLDDSELNGMMDAADAQTDRVAAARAWTKIDAQVMKDATMVPLVYDRHLVYRSARLTNVYQQQVLGQIDLSALGVQ